MDPLRRLRLWLYRATGDQRGNAIVLFSASMTVFVALAAIAVDVGRIYVYREQLKIVADGAVLAAARSLPDTTAANAAAQDILNQNGVPASGTASNVTLAPDGSSVSVALSRSVSTTFAQVLGISAATVPATSAAVSGPVKKVSGIVPFGVQKQTFNYGQQVTMKFSSDDNTLEAPGNFGALALSGTGASSYESDLENGYPTPVQVGDWLSTEPGNMDGPTDRAVTYRLNEAPHDFWNNYQPGSPRLIFVPIVDFSDDQGRGQVPVVGFAAFFLESVNGGTVTGRYLRAVTEADLNTGGPDYGLRAVKLTE